VGTPRAAFDHLPPDHPIRRAIAAAVAAPHPLFGASAPPQGGPAGTPRSPQDAPGARVRGSVDGKATRRRRASLPRAPGRRRHDHEATLARAIEAARLPAPVRQFAGAVPGRRFRIDFAWPDVRLAVEVQGWAGRDLGPHGGVGKMRADLERTAALVTEGWRVLPCDANTIRDGTAIEAIRGALRWTASPVDRGDA
jgi:very-short-patch-repair endonuclease